MTDYWYSTPLITVFLSSFILADLFLGFDPRSFFSLPANIFFQRVIHSACTHPYARFQYDTWLVPPLSSINMEPLLHTIPLSQEWWGTSRAKYHPLLRVWPSVFQGLICIFKPANLNIQVDISSWSGNLLLMPGLQPVRSTHHINCHHHHHDHFDSKGGGFPQSDTHLPHPVVISCPVCINFNFLRWESIPVNQPDLAASTSTQLPLMAVHPSQKYIQYLVPIYHTPTRKSKVVERLFPPKTSFQPEPTRHETFSKNIHRTIPSSSHESPQSQKEKWYTTNA